MYDPDAYNNMCPKPCAIPVMTVPIISREELCLTKERVMVEQPISPCGCDECQIPKPPLLYDKITTYKEVDPCLSYTEICFDWTYIIIFVLTFLIYIPFFLSYLFGITSTFYNNLVQTRDNHWFTTVLWITATIISYIGFYILWRNANKEVMYQNLIIAVLYLIGNFILVTWAVSLFQFQNIPLAVWLAFILFIYQFWVFIYIWQINRIAALFLIPLVVMYLFFFYDMIHLASLNNIPL